MTKNEIDINQLLIEDYVVPQSPFDKKRTKTSHFLLNTIFPSSSLMATEYFVNAFLADDEFQHRIIRPVFVLFKVSKKDAKWQQIASRLRAKPEFILEYFCGIDNKKDLVMMVFQVPEIYKNEYINFKEGKYSKFSNLYKKTFNRFTNNDKAEPVESAIWRVIHKSPELKRELESFFSVQKKHPYIFAEEDELWGVPQPLYEYYRYKTPI